jgi:hypothetical protein
MRVYLFLFEPILNNPFESRHIIFNQPEMKKHQVEFQPPNNKSQTTQSQLNKILFIPIIQLYKLIISNQIYSTGYQINTHEEKAAYNHS